MGVTMRKHLMQILLTLGAVFASLPTWAQGDGPRYWGGGPMMDWGWGPMMFGMLMMVVFMGGFILVIVLAVRWIGGSSADRTPSPASKSALDILNERFARGEIDKKEYEEGKNLLSS